MVDLNQTGSVRNEQVEAMFDDIARRYDFLNHFLSLGTDYFWRRKTIKALGKRFKPGVILDVATGTGDLAIASLRLNPEKVTGIDLSEKMLEIGREKIEKKRLSHVIELKRGKSEAIPFDEFTFDAVICAFGVRNFGDPLQGLAEMQRVLRPGGVVAILEFSRPSAFPFRQIYFFYFKRILPFMGRIISGDNTAYTYLPDSVIAFPEGDEFAGLMKTAGFQNAEYKRLSGGIATIYTASK